MLESLNLTEMLSSFRRVTYSMSRGLTSKCQRWRSRGHVS